MGAHLHARKSLAGGKHSVITVFHGGAVPEIPWRMATARNAEILIAEPLSKRRYRSKRERRQIPEETLQPGASMAVIALQHSVAVSQVFHGGRSIAKGGSM